MSLALSATNVHPLFLGAYDVQHLERQRLQRDHQHLDNELQALVARPHADTAKIQEIKKQKLAIKDRLHRIAPVDQGMDDAA